MYPKGHQIPSRNIIFITCVNNVPIKNFVICHLLAIIIKVIVPANVLDSHAFDNLVFVGTNQKATGCITDSKIGME